MKTIQLFQQKLTIRTKLLAACMILLIVPIMTISMISYKISSDEMTELINNNVRNNVEMAILLADSLNTSFQNGEISLLVAQEKVKTSLLGPREGSLRTIKHRVDLGDNGYFYVLDESGTLLAHPNQEGQNIWDKQTNDGFFYIQNVIEEARNGGGFTTYHWPLPESDKEAEKIVYSAYYPEWNWVIAAGSYLQDYDQGLSRMLDIMLITLSGCLVAGLAFSFLFARHIAKPIRLLMKQTTKIADGDLSEEELVIRNNDEIGRLGKIYSRMNHNLRKLVTQISANSDEVSLKLGNLTNSVHEIKQVNSQIAHSVQDISILTQTQAKNVEESADATEEMAQSIQRIAETSSTALEVSEHTAHEARFGNQLIERSTDQMTALRLTVSGLAQVIEQLNERSIQIGSIVQVMSEIASQTSLLSLNAAIEAARAGESGQGFAVVAHEVRKLSERSTESAEQVADLIRQIQENVAFAVQEMNKSEHEVNNSVDSVAQTGDAFKRILEATEQTVAQIQEASAASQQLSASAQEIAASLQEVKQMSGNTAASAESISSSTEEQLATMDEIVKAADYINQLANQLQRAAHQFKL